MQHQVHVRVGEECGRNTAGFGASVQGCSSQKTAACEWYSWFRNGQERVEDKPCNGRPSMSMNTEMIEKVRQMVHADHKIMLQEVANEVGILCGSVHASVTQEL